MIRALTVVMLLAVVAFASAEEENPARPTTAQVAKLLGIDKSRVTADKKPLNPRLEGKIHWLATYQISGKQDCSLAITLYPKGRIKTEFIEKAGKGKEGFLKLDRKDGDTVYHSLGGRDDEGTFFMTTLINHEQDWDLTLILSREPGVDETKLPFNIEEDGRRLVCDIEAILRKTKAEQ